MVKYIRKREDIKVNYLRRSISIMLVLAMLITSGVISNTKVVNAATEKEIYKDNNCRITFKVNSQWDSAFEGQFIITYKTTSDWGDAFNGEISIQNNTNKKIEGWELEFYFKKEITNFWTAKIKSKEENHYIIRNDEWNSIINPGDTVRLGFEGKSGNVTEEPQNYRLSKLEDDNNNESQKPEGDIDLISKGWKNR